MTPEERAKEFFKWQLDLPFCVPMEECTCKDCKIRHLTAEIQAAVEEAQIVMAEELTKADKAHCLQAKQLAYEDAAKIAGTHLKCMQNFQYSCAIDIANKIRARAAEIYTLPQTIDIQASHYGLGQACSCGGDLGQCRSEKFSRHPKKKDTK